MRIFRLFGELVPSLSTSPHHILCLWQVSPSTRFHPFRPSDDFLCYNCVKEAFRPGGQLVMDASWRGWEPKALRWDAHLLKNITNNKKRFEETISFQSFTVDVSKSKKIPFDPQVLETTLTVESVLVGIFALHSFLVGCFFLLSGFFTIHHSHIQPTKHWPRHDDSNSSGVFAKTHHGASRVGFCDRRQLQWSLCFFLFGCLLKDFFDFKEFFCPTARSSWKREC